MKYVLVTLGCVLWFGVSGSLLSAQSAGPPNLLVILCDDLGYGDLACYGHPTIQTPHLDRLAENGLRLTSCYSTAPVCSPSRVGLLTGRCPSRAGVYDWIPNNHAMHMGRDETTIAQLLKTAGYATGHVGKWHCNGKFNQPEQPQPGDHGFDHWFSTQNNAAPSHHNPGNFVRNGDSVGPLSGYSCQLVADEAIRWLENDRPTDQPFFLFVCFHEPHEPIDSPAELVDTYPHATKRGEALYYANVTNMDRAVGKLVTALDRMKLADDTLVWFTSDNGPETLDRYQGAWRSHGSPGPLRGMKLHLYEAGMRVPGIVRWPGKITPGTVSDQPVGAIDMLPTFCALAGVPQPDRELDGADIRGLWKDTNWQRTRPMYWHYFRSIGQPKAALRVGDYMILGHWDGKQLGPGGSLRKGDMRTIKQAELVGFELYRLTDDLSQQTDLSKKEPARFAALRDELIKKYRQVRDEGRSWEGY